MFICLLVFKSLQLLLNRWSAVGWRVQCMPNEEGLENHYSNSMQGNMQYWYEMEDTEFYCWKTHRLCVVSDISILASNLAENQGGFCPGRGQQEYKCSFGSLKARALLWASVEKSLFLSKLASFTQLPIWMASNVGLGLHNSPGGSF